MKYLSQILKDWFRRKRDNTSQADLATEKTWEAGLNAFKEDRNWEGLWQQLPALPLEWAVQTMLWLKEAGWRPQEKNEERVFDALAIEAEACRKAGPPPGMVYCLNVLKGHFDPIKALAFSPDGQLLASAGEDKTVRLWRVSDRSLLHVLEGQPYEITYLAFTPDSERLISGGRSKGRIWRVSDGTLFHVTDGSGYAAGAFALNSDGQTLLCGDGYGNMRSWNIAERTLRYCSEWNKASVCSLAIEPEKQVVVSGSDEHGLRLWRLSDGKPLCRLRKHRARIAYLAISPDGRFLASADYGHAAHLWHLPGGRHVKTLQNTKSHSYAESVAFSHDARLLAMGMADGEIKIWNIPKGDLLYTPQTGSSWNKKDLLFSPDGSLLIVAGKYVWLWRFKDRKILQKLEVDTETFTVLALSPDGKILASAGADVWLWAMEWAEFECLIPSERPFREFDVIKEKLHEEDLTDTQHCWLNMLRILMCRALSQKALALLQDKSSEMNEEELDILRQACREGEKEIAIDACFRLSEESYAEAADLVCARWVETQESRLGKLIAEQGYVARRPARVRVLSALWTAHEELLDSDDPDILAALLEICESDAFSLRERALNYTPRDPFQRAAFYFLTEQWKQYDIFDFDGSFLKSAYRQADAALRSRLTSQARHSGRLGLLHELAGLRSRGGSRLEQLTDSDWESTLNLLQEQRQWQKIRQLAQRAPAGWSRRMLLALQSAGWLPERETLRDGIRELTCLAARCSDDTPIPEHLLYRGATLERQHILAISPDSRLLTTYKGDHVIYLHDLPEGRFLGTLQGHDAEIMGARFSPDGRLLASRSADRSIRVWDLQTRRTLRTFYPQTRKPEALAFSFDGQYLVSSEVTGRLALWDLQSGKILRSFSGHPQETVKEFLITPDGEIAIAECEKNCAIWRWRIADGQMLAPLEGHRDSISCRLLHPDGERLMTGSNDRSIRVWNVKRGRLLQTFEGHADDVRSLALSPDGSLLASGGEDATLRLWNLREGLQLALLDERRRFHFIEFSPDGRMLLGSDQGYRVHFWRLPESTAYYNDQAQRKSWVRRMAFSPDRRLFITENSDSRLQIGFVPWMDLFHLNTRQAHDIELRYVETALRQEKMPDEERHWLEFVLALARWQRRFDIELGELPQHIEVGEFDIELG